MQIDYTLEALSNSDFFFYYGDMPLEAECAHDVMEIALQSKNSMSYFRDNGGGISGYENHPNTLKTQVMTRFAIADSLAKRNTYVASGQNDEPDRRVAVSQFSIDISGEGGNMDIAIIFFMFSNLNNPILTQSTRGA